MFMRHYPGLGVGHMHVHTVGITDSGQAIPQNLDPNGSDAANPIMESEEAEADIVPMDVTGGKLDYLDSTDDEGRSEDDLDDERWEDVEGEEMYALHEMYH